MSGHPFFAKADGTDACELCGKPPGGEHWPEPPKPAFWTFLVHVDRTQAPALTAAQTEAYLSAAFTRYLQDLEENAADAETVTDGHATAVLLFRGITLARVDLQAEADAHAEQVRFASENARECAELEYARKLPKVVHHARLDACVAAYWHALEKRASLVILVRLLGSTVKRWWSRRRAGLPVERHAR